MINKGANFLTRQASPQGGIIEPTATGVPGKPVFGLLGQVSGGYGEKKFKPRFSGAAD
jgi:hypothetical protein